MGKQDIAAAHVIIVESKCIIDGRVGRKKAHITIEKLGLFNPSAILRAIVAGKPTSYYHKRKSIVIQDIRQQKLEFPTFSSLPMIRSIRNEPLRHKKVRTYIQHRQQYRDLQDQIKKCQETITYSELCKACSHPTPKNAITGKSENLSKTYTCSQCQLRLTPHQNYLSTDVFDRKMCEFEHNFVHQLLLKHMDRLLMSADDMHGQLERSNPEVRHISRFILQRFGLACIYYNRNRAYHGKYVRSLGKRNALLYRRRIQYLITYVTCGTHVGMWISKRWAKIISKREIAHLRRMSNLVVIRNQTRRMAIDADQQFIENFRRNRQDYYKTTKKPSVILPESQDFRCFRPMCGGRRFLNRILFKKHILWHAEGDKRMNYERLFLKKIRQHPIPRLEMDSTPRTVVTKPTNKLSSPAIFLYVGNTPTTLPSIIPLREGPLTVGRSRECDVRLKSDKHPHLVSKTHISIELWYEKGYLHTHMSDLNSTNGVYVNGSRVREHLLQPDDMIEFGKVDRHNIVYMYKAVAPEKISNIKLPALFAPGCPPKTIVALPPRVE